MESLISIIIPVYNLENYIERCVNSILNQTYKNLEIIIVNDGSIDNSQKIIDKLALKDQRIKTVSQENKGVSMARLAGMLQATGDYVGFIDGDDYIEPEMYKVLLDLATQYNADIAQCGYVMDFPDGHKLFYYNTQNITVYNNEDGLKGLLKGDYIEPGLWNKLYKKTIIESFIENNLMDYSIKNLEDLLQNYCFFKYSNRLVYFDFPYYHYVLRKNSAAVKPSITKLLDPLRVFKSLMKLEFKNQDNFSIIYSRYLYALINIYNQNDYPELKEKGRFLLKAEKNRYMYKKMVKNVKLKCMVQFICDFEWCYHIIRNLYLVLFKTNKKFSINN